MEAAAQGNYAVIKLFYIRRNTQVLKCGSVSLGKDGSMAKWTRTSEDAQLGKVGKAC